MGLNLCEPYGDVVFPCNLMIIHYRSFGVFWSFQGRYHSLLEGIPLTALKNANLLRIYGNFVLVVLVGSLQVRNQKIASFLRLKNILAHFNLRHQDAYNFFAYCRVGCSCFDLHVFKELLFLWEQLILRIFKNCPPHTMNMQQTYRHPAQLQGVCGVREIREFTYFQEIQGKVREFR